MHQGGEFGLAKAHTPGEQRGMDTPFVLAAEPGRRAIDQDLALAQAERPLVEVTAGEDLGEDAWTARQGTEQQQRLDAGRHDALQLGGDGGFVRWRGGSDAGHATDYVAP